MKERMKELAIRAECIITFMLNADMETGESTTALQVCPVYEDGPKEKPTGYDIYGPADCGGDILICTAGCDPDDNELWARLISDAPHVIDELLAHISDLEKATLTSLEGFPTLYKAALIIAYDNGMVNRQEPEPKPEQIRVPFTMRELKWANDCLTSTHDQVLERICVGDNDTAQLILNNAFMANEVELVKAVLNAIFDALDGRTTQ